MSDLEVYFLAFPFIMEKVSVRIGQFTWCAFFFLHSIFNIFIKSRSINSDASFLSCTSLSLTQHIFQFFVLKFSWKGQKGELVRDYSWVNSKFIGPHSNILWKRVQYYHLLPSQEKMFFEMKIYWIKMKQWWKINLNSLSVNLLN